jgi:hypothetical protein
MTGTATKRMQEVGAEDFIGSTLRSAKAQAQQRRAEHEAQTKTEETAGSKDTTFADTIRPYAGEELKAWFIMTGTTTKRMQEVGAEDFIGSTLRSAKAQAQQRRAEHEASQKSASSGTEHSIFMLSTTPAQECHQGITYSDSHYTEDADSEVAMRQALSNRGDSMRFELGL